MENKFKISLVAVNWWAEDFEKILTNSALFKAHDPSSIELIIVDNSGEIKAEEADNLKIIKPEQNLGHGAGMDLGISKAQGKYVLLMDIDTHILLKDWDRKLIHEFEQNDKLRLAVASDSGLLKPARPLTMFFERDMFIWNNISLKAVELQGVKFDVGVHAYFRVLTLFGDKSVLKLPYKKTDYEDVLGNEYTLNGIPLVYHNWYGTRWYDVDGKVRHQKIDGVTREDFLIKKNNLFKQLDEK